MGLATADEPYVWAWDVESFLRAEEAGVFGPRQVELIAGEVRCAVHGEWHGRALGLVVGALVPLFAGSDWAMTFATLALDGSAPDPDVWWVRAGAAPVARVGRLARYDIGDVLLVLEVGDATERDDLGVMAELYASAGVANYWVVTRSGVYVHTGPQPDGRYADRHLVGLDGTITVPGVAAEVAVAALIPH